LKGKKLTSIDYWQALTIRSATARHGSDFASCLRVSWGDRGNFPSRCHYRCRALGATVQVGANLHPLSQR